MYGGARSVSVGDVHLERARVSALTKRKKIDFAGRRKPHRDARRLRGIDASRDAVIPGQLERDDEIRRARRADGAHDLADKARAPFEVAAVCILTHVGPAREELVEQMPVAARQLDAGEAAALYARGALREVVDEALDFIGCERVRHGAADVVGQRGGADRVETAPSHVVPAPRVLHLPQQAAVVRFDRRRPALETVDVVIGPDLDSRRPVLVRRHVHRLGDDQRSAAARAVDVILDQAIGHRAVVRQARRDRCVNHAVAQPPAVVQCVRRQQRRIKGITALYSCCHLRSLYASRHRCPPAWKPSHK